MNSNKSRRKFLKLGTGILTGLSVGSFTGSLEASDREKQEKELSTEFYRPAGWGAVSAIIGREMMPIMKGEIGLEDGMAKIVELSTPDFERTKCKF